MIVSLLATEHELDLFFFALLALAVETAVVAVAAKDTFWDRRCGKEKHALDYLWQFNSRVKTHGYL